MSKITSRLWSEEEFSHSKNQWNELLERSNADRLFLCWEWVHTWWKCFSDAENCKLFIVSVYDESDKLIGLAPLYIKKSLTKKILRTNRLQFIGSSWHCGKTMRSEFLEFIADKNIESLTVKKLIQYIDISTNWNEFVLKDLRKDSETYVQFKTKGVIARVYERPKINMYSYYVDTKGAFKNYLSSLGKNTRLKLFNRRNRLRNYGAIKYVDNSERSVEYLFGLLDELHQKRWSKSVFTGHSLDFNKSLANLMKDKGMLKFSLLMLDNQVVSIQYNYLIGHHEYNIQSGFDCDLDSKLALGYLHFGYAIESACESDIQVYDFLSGEGKKTNYKSHMTSDSEVICNLHFLRGWWLRLIFSLYDFIR